MMKFGTVVLAAAALVHFSGTCSAQCGCSGGYYPSMGYGYGSGYGATNYYRPPRSLSASGSWSAEAETWGRSTRNNRLHQSIGDAHPEIQVHAELCDSPDGWAHTAVGLLAQGLYRAWNRIAYG